ncbi:hypothetical protein GCK32_006957 [Trichostrongylus colubriformis]|uniref:Activin types I and II receptor domain-containing protein n=1 Tax=Trichostrongylus colubriformis TaxID=6319 RepID=A0AAN8FPJ4_TRICO
MLLFYLASLPLVTSLKCYDFVDRQIGGSILHGPKQIVECSDPEFCLSIYQEGNNENIYSALCANNTNFRTKCQTVTCTHSHANEYSTDTCCCNTDLCNMTPNKIPYMEFILLSLAIAVL